MWEAQWGASAGDLKDYAIRSGTLPKSLAEAPELPLYLTHYLSAYKVLHRSRAEGFSGYQPITIEAMEAYCRLHEINDRLFFVYAMQEMDDGFLQYVRKKGEQDSGRHS